MRARPPKDKVKINKVTIYFSNFKMAERGAKLSEYWKLIRPSQSRNNSCEMNSEYVNGKLVTDWTYNCDRRRFLAGSKLLYKV